MLCFSLFFFAHFKMLLFVLFSLASAKCGLWYQFSHTQERDGPHYSNGGWGVDAGWGWAAGYGYESLDQFVICNDMEMFHQCDRAQEMLETRLSSRLDVQKILFVQLISTLMGECGAKI